MAKLLRMPEVAAGATTVVLSEWPLADNATFAIDDALAVIETDKAVVDVEAEYPGVLLKTLVPAGSEVEVGAPIALLGDEGEKVADIDTLLAELGVSDVAHAATPAPAPAAAAPATAQPKPATATAPRGRIFASPLARRLAADAGLDLSGIEGTGPNGRVTKRDVLAAASRAVDAAPRTTAAAAGAGYTDEPHSKLRRAIAQRLTESKQTQPHFYIHGTARVDALLEARAQLNQISPTKISVNDMLIKALAKAHQLVPQMNAIWTPDAIRRFDGVDISVAIASDRGLLTPVLRNVDKLSISEIASATKDFVVRAQEGKIKQAELEGGSTTISNLGMYGVPEFSAIINPPQSSILAVGAAAEEPVAVDGRLEVATVLRVVLSVDHRPVDGAHAAEWMKHFTDVLENPLRMFA
ncbi:dihydrolipoamide acetyltransferase family protein [Rhodococcus sp. ACT016]|uniref:dihydrolipoamide acetyltransferase family protein n=1 Tax=Rhodococcus sp. ACT016 TaxID=3134808 RepID=UPI003D278C86